MGARLRGAFSWLHHKSNVAKILQDEAMKLNISPRTLHSALQRVIMGVPLQRKEGSGRKRTARTAELWEELTKKIHETEGSRSTREYAMSMKSVGLSGSQSTILRSLREHATLDLMQTRPTLSSANMQKRLDFAVKFKRLKPARHRLLVCVDEKWFFGYRLKRKYWRAKQDER